MERCLEDSKSLGRTAGNGDKTARLLPAEMEQRMAEMDQRMAVEHFEMEAKLAALEEIHWAALHKIKQKFKPEAT